MHEILRTTRHCGTVFSHSAVEGI